MPDVANDVGVESSKTIDKLYDQKTNYISGALGYLKDSKKIHKLAKKPPRDALITIRLADIKSRERTPEKHQEQ
jgi:hypothetical protein